MQNFLNNVEAVVVEAAAAAGQTTLTTDAIDMAGWTGVCFEVHFGDVTAASVLDFAIEHSDEAGANFTEITDGALTKTADGTAEDNKLWMIDVVRPTKRYVRATLARGSQNAVVNGIRAYKYGPRNAPVTQGSTVLGTLTLPNGAAA